MQICLTVIEGPHEGQVFTFAGHDTFLVGRSKKSHFRLPHKDKYFSRVHFLMELNAPSCRVMDMGSRNGTYVNGQRIRGAVDLKDGDLITAGHSVLRLGLVAGAGDQVAPSPVAVPAPGELKPFAGFEFVRELGRGSLGTVYLAKRAADGVLVALKVVVPAVTASPAQAQRFLREASLLRQLEHPHLARLLGLGESDLRIYFALEYVPGTDAAALVKQGGPMTVKTAVAMIGQVLAALEYAHGLNFVHRDIKPSNVLMAADGTVKLTDFGLARIYQASQLSGLSLTRDPGGPAFMPPERVTQYQSVQPAADQYAVAATLYYLLTGQYVYDFKAEVHRKFTSLLSEEPVPIRKRRADIPGELAAVIHKALAREPRERFAEVKEFALALQPFG